MRLGRRLHRLHLGSRERFPKSLGGHGERRRRRREIGGNRGRRSRVESGLGRRLEVEGCWLVAGGLHLKSVSLLNNNPFLLQHPLEHPSNVIPVVFDELAEHVRPYRGGYILRRLFPEAVFDEGSDGVDGDAADVEVGGRGEGGLEPNRAGGDGTLAVGAGRNAECARGIVEDHGREKAW